MAEQVAEGLAVPGIGGQTAGDGQHAGGLRAQGGELQRAEGLDEAFGQDGGGLGVLAVGLSRGLGVPEQHRELVSADAGDDVVLAGDLPHQCGGLDQDLVAGGVAVGVVVTLEIVDVVQQQGDAELLRPRLLEQLVAEVVEVPPVVRAGKEVGDGQPAKGIDAPGLGRQRCHQRLQGPQPGSQGRVYLQVLLPRQDLRSLVAVQQQQRLAAVGFARGVGPLRLAAYPLAHQLAQPLGQRFQRPGGVYQFRDLAGGQLRDLLHGRHRFVHALLALPDDDLQFLGRRREDEVVVEVFGAG